MGVQNYLIEGVSGVGKTTVCDELNRRGYQAIHGDRQLAYQGDPQTGEPTDGFAHENHIWRLDEVRALIADHDHEMTFFCGGSRNFDQFVDLLDRVFVLTVDVNTLDRRLDQRDPDEYGHTDEERAIVHRMHRTGEDTPPGVIIDATPPVDQVVDEVLRRIHGSASNVWTQVETERAAMTLIERPDVRAAVAAAADRWRAGTAGLLSETYAQLPASIDEVVLLVALQVINSDPRRPRVVEISAGPHAWGGLEVPGGRWGINNPDTLYFAVPIEAESHYLLRGRPTGAPPTDINISVQTPDVWGTLDSLGHRDLAYEPDGSFAIMVGEGSVDTVPNRLMIKDGGTVLLIRQTLAGWSAELPYELSIERIGGPETEDPPSEDDHARQLIRRLGVVIDHSLEGLQPPIFGLPVNTIPQPGAAGDKPGYLVSQRNALGHFRLADGEALVLVISPGGAGYAAVAAPNVWGVTADSARHQNSLNNRQAALDPDGRMTVVVANEDPGVINWVDPSGPREGILMLRWQLLDEQPEAPDEPGVLVQHAQIADLQQILPTATRVSPHDRRIRIAERAAAYGRRFTLRETSI